MDSFYENKNKKYFDSRGIFLICTQNKTYIWIGNDIKENILSIYKSECYKYVKILNKYENCCD